MAEATSFWEYVKRAFHAKVPVKGLGPISLNKWFLAGAAILGFGAPPVWLLGLGAEMAYLYWLSTNPRFRRLVDGERLAGERDRWDKKVKELETKLDRESMSRNFVLAAKCREVQALSAVSGAPVAPLEEAKVSGMDQLIYMHLRLLVSRATLNANFAADEKPRLVKEIERLEREVATPGIAEAVKRSKQGTLEIQKKRLENLDRVDEQRAVIESELERIEKQVELIREDTAMGREPLALSSRIDTVVNSLGETSEWMKKNADLLGNIGEEKPREVPIFLEPPAVKEGG
jgi:hypothetical protein